MGLLCPVATTSDMAATSAAKNAYGYPACRSAYHGGSFTLELGVRGLRGEAPPFVASAFRYHDRAMERRMHIGNQGFKFYVQDVGFDRVPKLSMTPP